MDADVQAVLDHYHARIEEEAERPWNGDDRDTRLLPVGPETGRLMNVIARSMTEPHILEIGTSYGYSGIWLAEAARAAEGRLTTLELADYKSAYAKGMAAKAGLAAYVDFRVGDALALIEALPAGIDFVLLDLWKDLYEPCFRAFYPKLKPGAIIVADNILYPEPGEGIHAYLGAVRSAPGMTSVLLPVGSGIEVSRFDP